MQAEFGLSKKKTSAISSGGLCSHYLSSRAVARQVLSAYMSLTSVFGMGSDGSAACGGFSDLSDWQRSVNDAGVHAKESTGNRNRKQVDPSTVPMVQI